MKVFVYGTLKKGFHNHRCLEGALFEKEAVLSKAFRMFDTGGFPVILPASTNAPGYFPTGEVYVLPEGVAGEKILHRLDALESEGYMYHRKEFETLDGDVVSVYVGDERVFDRFAKRQVYLGPNIKLDPTMETCTYVRDAA